MDWDRPILTDSGGFQVFSLGALRKITRGGRAFRSPVNGDAAVPHARGVDAGPGGARTPTSSMVFDECTPYTRGDRKRRHAQSMELSMRWAQRSRDAVRGTAATRERAVRHRAGRHVLTLRVESLAGLVDIGFDGYAIGGLAVGEPTEERFARPGAHRAPPAGGPAALPDGRRDARGHRRGRRSAASTCSTACLPTRNARNGHLFTRHGVLKIRNRPPVATISRPLDAACGCHTCRHFSPRLPASPRRVQRNPRRAAEHHPQPALTTWA